MVLGSGCSMMPAAIIISSAAATRPDQSVSARTASSVHQSPPCAAVLITASGAAVMLFEAVVTTCRPPGAGLSLPLPRFALRRGAPRSRPGHGRAHIAGSQTEAAPRLRAHDQSVGLDFPGAEPDQVVLHIRLEVVGVPRIGQVLAGRGHQVLGPAQALGLDEVEVESEPIDDEVVREVAGRGGHALDVRDHRAGDVQAARIVVAAVEQDAGLALVFALEEASHRAGSAVEACPTADIDQWDRVALADVREEGLQVDLLDPHLDVIFAIVPKAHRIVLVMNVIANVLDPASGELFRGLVVEFLDMLGGARL